MSQIKIHKNHEQSRLASRPESRDKSRDKSRPASRAASRERPVCITGWRSQSLPGAIPCTGTRPDSSGTVLIKARFELLLFSNILTYYFTKIMPKNVLKISHKQNDKTNNSI